MLSRNIKILIVGLIVIGVTFIILGFQMYGSVLVSPASNISHQEIGLFSSHEFNVGDNLSDYDLLIYVNTLKKSANMEFDLMFTSTSNQEITLVLRHPSEPLNTVVTNFNQEIPYENEQLSGIYYTVCSFQANQGQEYYISFKAEWDNYLTQLSYSRFHMVIPIDLNYLQSPELSYFGPDMFNITPDIANSSFVCVQMPVESTNIQFVPIPATMTYVQDNIWYFWNGKSISEPLKFVSTAISIDFDSSHLLDEKEKSTFISGVFLTAGFGIITGIITSFVFFWKAKRGRQKI